MADANATRRDDVLVAFHAACPRPSADDVAAWVDRHPDLADDIRAHAEALLAGIQDRHLRPEPSPALLARTRATALDALEAAHARATAPGRARGLADLAAAAGTNVPRLARALGLGRAPLVDLVQGRVTMPAPRALVSALADALRTTVAAVEAALEAAAASPGMGLAKAEVTSMAPRRAFADVVRDDPTMTPVQKDRWLSLAREG